MKEMRRDAEWPPLRHSGRRESGDPESRRPTLNLLLDSGFALSARPGMTKECRAPPNAPTLSFRTPRKRRSGIQTPDSELASGFRVRACSAPRNDEGNAARRGMTRECGATRNAPTPSFRTPRKRRSGIQTPDSEFASGFRVRAFSAPRNDEGNVTRREMPPLCHSGRRESGDPESRRPTLNLLLDSGFALSARPGMTKKMGRAPE
jgi:hypothetical protein